MTNTPFGLEVLAPGQALSTDNYRFQAVNPLITDFLLGIGAIYHRHDAHAAMANPTEALTVDVEPTGGTLPAGTDIYLTYTLVDPQGAETLPVDTQVVTTPSGYGTPQDAPTATVSFAGGLLLVNTYLYAVSLRDGLGGETPLGPPVVVDVPASANASVQLSGLSQLTADGSDNDPNAQWELWRSVDGGNTWAQFAIGAASVDTFNDEGTISGNTSVIPAATDTTGGHSSLQIAIPGGQPADAQYVNLYGSTDPTFPSPSLLTQYASTIAGAGPQVFTSLSPQAGTPPIVSGCLGGANQINPDTDILNWPWKQPVVTIEDLPTEGNSDGDSRIVISTYTIYLWHAATSSWVGAVGGEGGSESFKDPVATTDDLPSSGNTDGDIIGVLADHQLYIWDAATTAWNELGGGSGGGGLTTLTVAGTEYDSVTDLALAAGTGATLESSVTDGTVTVIVGATGGGSGGDANTAMAQGQYTFWDDMFDTAGTDLASHAERESAWQQVISGANMVEDASQQGFVGATTTEAHYRTEYAPFAADYRVSFHLGFSDFTGPSTGKAGIGLRMVEAGSGTIHLTNYSGYLVYYENSVITLARLDSGVETVLGTFDDAQPGYITAGIVGATINVWADAGTFNASQLVISADDGTYTDAGEVHVLGAAAASGPNAIVGAVACVTYYDTLPGGPLNVIGDEANTTSIVAGVDAIEFDAAKVSAGPGGIVKVSYASNTTAADGAYTLSGADIGNVLLVGDAAAIEVPTDEAAATPFPADGVSGVIRLVDQSTGTAMTFTVDSGATVSVPPGKSLASPGPGAVIDLVRLGTDAWAATGDLATA